MDRDLHEAGERDLDLDCSWRNFNSLKVAIMALSSPTRIEPPCFTLLLVDFLETGFLWAGAVGGGALLRRNSIDLPPLSSCPSGKLRQGTVTNATFFVVFPPIGTGMPPPALFFFLIMSQLSI